MNRKKNPFFAFSYGSTDPMACFAFYFSDGKLHADYRDENGADAGFSGLTAPENFWDKLSHIAEELGMFDWKAPKFFHRFVLNIDVGVLNLEALFPDGRKLAANSMNGDPPNLKEAFAAVRDLFVSASV